MKTARLAYLTQPSPDVILLNLQVAEDIERVEITRDQLRNILIDGAAMAFREQKVSQSGTQA
jgi:hypothetical protein